MQINSASVNPLSTLSLSRPDPRAPEPKSGAKGGEVREAFDQFVGEVFFGQMLDAMRKTVGKAAYFHGGRAEEVFTQQLDQVLAEQLTESSAKQFSEPMFELFMQGRSR